MRNLILNADDFGISKGVNQGIVEAHARGVVTSASLMVTRRAAEEAAELARVHSSLAVGLHWDAWGEDGCQLDLRDDRAVRAEFTRQVDRFWELMGRPPTHVDSHHQLHREPGVTKLFEELVEPLGVPLRGGGRVRVIGGFYGQSESNVTNLEYVSVPFLQRMLREEVREGWTEIYCHPGYRTPDYQSAYLAEREEEIRTLTDPRVRTTIAEEGIRLRSYAEVPR